MRILLSNDDGIHAPGLKALERIAYALSDDVWVVAPELDQSGSSHSLTLRDPLRLREISPKKFAINGTPTDCVMVGVNHLMKDSPPTVVLSGVNYGGNLAEDITYSGTVAAAMEACLLGIPAVALSLETSKGHPAKWATVENFAPKIIQDLLNVGLHDNVFINLNFPNLIVPSVKGALVTNQGQRHYIDNLEERVDPRGHRYFWVGTVNHDGSGDIGTDLAAIMDGYISITPLSLNLTHLPTINQLEQVFR